VPPTCATSTRLEAVLRASIDAIDPVAADTVGLLAAHDLAAHAFAVELLAREALTNAILHGSACDPGKTVRYVFEIRREWLLMTVEDGGPGFDWRASAAAPVDDGATRGRGVSIFGLYADHVVFNRRGNRLVLRRRISRERN
jgi:serine/threonine-protein kinase RsbW